MANTSTVLGLGLLCCVMVCVCLSSCASAGMFVQKGGLSALVSGAVSDALGAATGGVVGGGGTGQLGQLTKPDGKCGNNGVKNDAGKCVLLTVESSEFGGSKGDYKYNECPDNEYVQGIATGYDEKVQEIKYMAASCSDGNRNWSVGREAPSSLGKMIAGVATMGISSLFTKETGYDSRSWVDPAKPGWDQFGMITSISDNGAVKAKPASNLRAFGPNTATNSAQATGMFGVNDNRAKQSNILDKDRFTWRCDAGGKAPKGKRYALVGIGAASDGKKITRAKFKCRMFDVQ